ncbi:MAG: hypothetical protein Q6351_007000 [Candidatus Njordarchaeum guaymaensis]
MKADFKLADDQKNISPEQILAVLSKFRKLAEEGRWPGLKIVTKERDLWIDLPDANSRWFVSLKTPRGQLNTYFVNETDPAEIAAFVYMLLKADRIDIWEGQKWNQ